MKLARFGLGSLVGLAMAFLALTITPAALAGPLFQQPTVAIPTVTGTPAGPMASVMAGREDFVNIRSGPGSDYPIIGKLVIGQKVPALGRTPGGSYIQIAYPGAPDGVAWIFAPYVELTPLGVELPIVEPPPTPTPRVTPTIDPTLAAQFIVEIPPTRAPTFTPPPPLVVPTFAPEEPIRSGTGAVPAGLVIMGLGIVGMFGMFISLLRGR